MLRVIMFGCDGDDREKRREQKSKWGMCMIETTGVA